MTLVPPGRAPRILRYRILPFVLFCVGAILLCNTGTTVTRAPSRTDTEIKIRMLYSGEKKAWITTAAAQFMKHHAGINLELVSMDSMRSVNAIATGQEEALVWSPASTTALNLLRSEWSQKHSTEAFSMDGADAPQPMLLSPMVWLMWTEHAPLLAQLQQRLNPSAPDSLSWSTVHAALTSERGWQGLGGKAVWGAVKLGYADPSQFNSGFQTLYLMTQEFFRTPRRLNATELASPEYRAWLADFQALSAGGETSTTRMLNDMLRYGPSKYDLVMTYESQAMTLLKRSPQSRWGGLYVLYPPATVWNDHPVVLLKTSHWNDEHKRAARRWIEFLISPAMQQQAADHGFRPADPSLSFESKDPNKPDPFTKSQAHGIRLYVPAVPRTPTGAEARLLLELWEQPPPMGTPDGGLSP